MSRRLLAAVPALLPALAWARFGDNYGDSGVAFVLLLVVSLICLFLYLLPTYIAFKRRHRNRVAILVLNVFLGWMGLGWIGALVWSLTSNREATTVIPAPIPAGDAHPLAGLYGHSNATPAAPTPMHKDCPYCGEQILAVAIRCKHCHADLSEPATS